MHRCRWAQAASGAAGWANVGLCTASSFPLKNLILYHNGKSCDLFSVTLIVVPVSHFVRHF